MALSVNGLNMTLVRFPLNVIELKCILNVKMFTVQ
jgi:hypothetical protein